MASGPTPRRRKSSRQGEPDTGTKGEPAASGPKPEELSGAPAAEATPAAEIAPAAEITPAAEIAPAADSAVAAASAAASAAAAAVSAAIAATVANNANRARSAPAPIVPAAAAATPPPLAAPTEPPLPVQYERPPGREVSGLTRANHDSEAAPAAPAPSHGDISLPYLPGIVRAPIEPAQDVSTQSVPPSFTTDDDATPSTARSGRKARIVGPVAGVAAALLAAGSALGHSIGARRSFGKPVRETPSASAAAAQLGIQPPMPPEPSPYAPSQYAPSPYAPSPYAQSPYAQSPYAPPSFLPMTQVTDLPAPAVVRPAGLKGTAPYRFLALVGSILAVVFLPIILGLGRLALIPAHAISGRLAGGGSGGGGSANLDFDEYGNPRKKRRVSPLWLAFGGFYGFLAIVIAVAWLAGSVLPPAAPSSSPTASHVIALASVSASPTSTPSPSAKPTVITAAPTAKPITPIPATPKPATPVPTVRITPKPTVKITPVPTPTPPVNFVAFVPAGGVRSDGTTNYTASYTAPAGTSVVLIIDALGGSNCVMTSTAPGSGSKPATPATIKGTPPQVGSMIVLWGRTWTKGPPYTVTATCTHAGMPTVKATQQVTIT